MKATAHTTKWYKKITNRTFMEETSKTENEFEQTYTYMKMQLARVSSTNMPVVSVVPVEPILQVECCIYRFNLELRNEYLPKIM